MERYAQRVRDLIGVPVSLVSLVQADQQVFPGMCGLPDPWASRRSTPLSHSFCQHVVASGEPLVIEDAREDDLVRDNLATSEIGVVAYAGMPLTDSAGHVLGSLCAIDTEPRAWTEAELTLLRDIALDCCHELRLRLSLLDAERERARRDAIDQRLQLAMSRSIRLLSIAEALNACRTVDDVRHELSGFVDSSTGLIDAVLHLFVDGPIPSLPEHSDVGPSGVMVVADLDVDTGGLPADEVEAYRDRGGRSVGFLPVRGSADALAVVELLWDRPRRLDTDEHAMASALGTYASQALERALLLEDRMHVAQELQAAMLADLPTDTGLDVAACYLPAKAEERVGGDWYDVFEVPDSSAGASHRVLVSVGDVTGHDIAAAAVMGQLRAMLRQAAWDHPRVPPSELIAQLELACQAFEIPATGTALLSHLTPSTTGSGWTFTWSNAGHPPPVLVRPDGTVERLEHHDLLFGHPDLLVEPRANRSVELPSGSTLVLHTDGVTDGHLVDAELQLERLDEVVTRLHGRDAQTVVDGIAHAFTGMTDDVVAVAVVVP